jgi:hypothetical protein
MTRIATLACLLLVLSFHGLRSQNLNPVTLEFLVNQHIPGEQSWPHVASGEDGGYVIAWRSTGQDDGGRSIRVRRYGPDHQPLTDEILVTTGLGSASTNRPFVHYWKEDRYVIRWTTSSGPGGYRVLNADNSLEDPHAISLGTDNDVDILGDVMLTAYTSSQHIRLRKWDLLTNEWMGPYVQASEIPSNDYKFPQVRWTSTGGVVAVYKGGTPSPHRIYRKPFNGDLLAQAPEDFIHSTNGTMQVINISINAQDEVLVYAQLFSNGFANFVGRILDAQGNVLVQGVGNLTANNANPYSDCELFDNGSLVLTNSYRPTQGDPLDYCVRANYALNLGSPNTGFQFASNTTSGNQRYPAVTKLPNEGFLVVWNGNGFQGDDDGVYARAFAATDFPTAAPEREGLAFEAFPNPFRDRLVLSMEEPGPLQVFDAMGRLVHTERLVAGPNALPLEQLSPGTYLLVWYAANGTRFTHRVVKE